ncbi:MAG: MFS transporter [Actinomycetota bacterium]|nr:MFS transporter [Actinomycetota bacterium]
MRRLLLVISAIVLVDTALYAALAPILPGYADRFDLSKAEAGFLVAAFGLGALAAAVPAGVAAARFGPKPTVLAALALLSVASVGFGLAPDLPTLAVSRLLQGVASTLSWVGGLAWIVAAAPRDGRGALIGRTIAAAVVGALLGPALGAAATLVGTRIAFGGVALFALLLFVAALGVAGTDAEPHSFSAVVGGLRDRHFLFALWVTLLPSLLFGVLAVLVPLQLGSRGWGAVAISGVFIAAALVEAVIAPLTGRLSDRRGRLLPIRAALIASVAVSLALAGAGAAVMVALFAVLAGAAYGALYPPGTAFVADVSDRIGVSHGLAFAVAQIAWAAGNVVGPSAGGTVAQIAGDDVAYAAAAAISFATLVAASTALGPAVGVTPRGSS